MEKKISLKELKEKSVDEILELDNHASKVEESYDDGMRELRTELQLMQSAQNREKEKQMLYANILNAKTMKKYKEQLAQINELKKCKNLLVYKNGELVEKGSIKGFSDAHLNDLQENLFLEYGDLLVEQNRAMRKTFQSYSYDYVIKLWTSADERINYDETIKALIMELNK